MNQNKKRVPRPLPIRKEDVKPIDKVFIYNVMFQFGILPMEDPTLDMRIPLRKLSADEARVIKRKFRKLWRKYMREQQAKSKSQIIAKNLPAQFGVGKLTPSRSERLERKRVVCTKIWYDHIVPMLDKLENPERKTVASTEPPMND
jgi:hypothetical protein